MRIQHRYLTFDKNESLTRLLDRLTVKYEEVEKKLDGNVNIYVLEFYLYEDNPRFGMLREAIEPFGLQPQIASVFEKDDVEKAEWFIASTGEYQYPQPDNGFGYLKATFNLDDYCPQCGIGKIQNAPFRLKTMPKHNNNQFWGLHWEYEPVFVRQEAKNILEKEIQGISFSNPVLHKKNAPIEGFYQLHIEQTLKEGYDSYNAQTITCTINNEENLNMDLDTICCGRVKFHHPMIGGYLFDRAIFDMTSDIGLTYEYFGSGASANKLVIVSKRFKQLIDSNKLKGLEFTPIIHERFKR